VEGIADRLYIRKEDAQYLEQPVEFDGEMRVLAPLDNFLWDRLLIEKLFGFKYSWEVYLPVEKRKYGYYVLPVLYRNQLVARFEPEQHRGTEPPRIKQWWWENAAAAPELAAAAESGLKQFAAYLGAEGFDPASVPGLIINSTR
jgi:uncharacterized protein YcaQ